MNIGELNGKPLTLEFNETAFTATHAWTEPTQGLHFLTVTLTANGAPALPDLILKWRIADIDIQGQWHPCSRDTKHLMPPWNGWYQFNATNNAPVFCLYSIQGENRFLVALSDVINTTELFCATRESLRAEFELGAKTKPEPGTEVSQYSITVRFDTRDIGFSESLRQVATWWEELGYLPRSVPPSAREPHYSSWYIYHDNVNKEDLLKEAKTAHEIGCKVFLLDDGWQKDEHARDKDRSLGDWTPKDLPRPNELADALHAMDMKFVMWFATPFVTETCNNWKLLADCCFDTTGDWHCLDFRYPKAREHIATLLSTSMRDWNLDGLKVDFIDSIPKEGQDPRPGDTKRDTQSRSEGNVRMLDEVMNKLLAVRTDPLIEFRQGYIGPVMRKYATAFRGFDCPSDSINNRILTTDIRLICGKTPVHSDMFIWSIDEPVEVGALQFANILFSVPQISTSIGQLPKNHLAMLKFYVTFWLKHRELLLDGEFTAYHPEANYPLLTAQTSDAWIAGVYVPMSVNLPSDKKRWTIVNASGASGIVVTGNLGLCHAEITDCMGNIVSSGSWKLDGVSHLPIPPCGTWIAVAADSHR